MAGVDQLEPSEDCLYLNVWTTNLSAPQKQPVMLWIHGGGHVEGSSHTPLIEPALARKGVIVVSLDYRFGVLGYRLAGITTQYGQPAYLSYFSYVGRGPFARLGAFHSEEMMFVGDTYWKSWKPDEDDKKLAALMGDYWTQFGKDRQSQWNWASGMASL